MSKPESTATYAMIAEFSNEESLLAAIHQVRRLGYQHIDAFSPYPVDGAAEALGLPHTSVPFWTLVGGMAGGVAAYALMAWVSVWAYPINVGGRPLNSWPAFVPITFELTVLGAALAAFFSMLLANGLPRLHHPLFGVEEFSAASRDRFFLGVMADDPLFDPVVTADVLAALPANRVIQVPQ